MTSDTHNKYVYDAHINSTFIASYDNQNIYCHYSGLKIKMAKARTFFWKNFAKSQSQKVVAVNFRPSAVGRKNCRFYI